ncbi:leucine rich repeat containing 8 family, member C [Rattus norvegicus]|uniref:Leucine rich repeat containing 8 family, member C n=1 Tax=Rattus norvegicus TaxID=10116 RepID=A6K5Q3_RAT|nr:leucine rich repeat containing 8 family, member C [Rattus norvegicus]
MFREVTYTYKKHDSSDRVPAVLRAAACLPGAEAVVGCVHGLPLGGHADDRGVWMYFTRSLKTHLLKLPVKMVPCFEEFREATCSSDS